MLAFDQPLVIYAQQQVANQQLTQCLEDFLNKHPEWQSRLAFTHVCPGWRQSTSKLTKAPVHRPSHYHPDQVKDAAICVLLLPPQQLQEWLLDFQKADDDALAALPDIPKYILAVDPSCSSKLPPTPPLLPVERYQLMTLPSLDQLPTTLHSILSRIVAQRKMALPTPADPLPMETMVTQYQQAKNRLFLFDYDGTLTPIVSRPEMALPSPSLLTHLKSLCMDPANNIWIVSGRDQKFLQQCFGHLQGIGLSAEHGSFMKFPGETQWIDMLKDVTLTWKDQALDLFHTYTQGLPGTEIEEKKSSITWHYRNALDVEKATQQSEICRQQLLKVPGVDILVGKMNVEVRSLLVNKGNVVNRIRHQDANALADFILCAGDDQTDEDMFRALLDAPAAHAILVGPASKSTLAPFRVDDSHIMVDLLGQFASVSHHACL
ncbi:hypothetical protein DM01DRAFT_1339515 [Hesseltinella vesiculosa]|uniref:Trehalose 6-phosphate phosphatase n=1 Tax=Hesseltinella vesiculosa TaxID=101127 RepID=A0A1X2G6P5_9FUNG|nr:hypothetical protein DM01DRAFT_1339515 [Hesseltinella vesiculosa]